MQEHQVPQPPADVENQTTQIVQSGIAELVYPGVEVDGGLEDLYFWAGFQAETCCVLLSVFARRRDGGVGNGVVLQSALYVARNRVANPEDSGDLLDLPRLQLLERLALESEGAALDQQSLRDAWLSKRS